MGNLAYVRVPGRIFEDSTRTRLNDDINASSQLTISEIPTPSCNQQIEGMNLVSGWQMQVSRSTIYFRYSLEACIERTM